jgi:D-arabinose 1-dehydrogenase-like Zn-dependent alcohol dehydrogenase
MNMRRADRLWMLGGLFGIIVLVVAAYLLAIKPIYTDKAEKQGQADDQGVTLVTLKTQLNQLKAKAKNQAAYTAQLNAKTAAMPDSYDVPNYLRALQTSGTAVNVAVSGVSVGSPAKVTGLSDVITVPINLTATGAPADLGRFIDRLQNVQSRAVLITSVSLSAGAATSDMSATFTVSAFCRKSTKCSATG